MKMISNSSLDLYVGFQIPEWTIDHNICVVIELDIKCVVVIWLDVGAYYYDETSMSVIVSTYLST